MNKEQLINMLKYYDNDIEILIFDAETKEMEPVTGCTVGASTVELHSDTQGE